jgi:hypothetical protein
MTDRARSGIVTRGAAVVAQARARMAAQLTDNRSVAAPQREDLQGRLDAIRAEQSALFRAARSSGLTAKQHARAADLGREELKLIADLRDLGKRRIGERHKRR